MSETACEQFHADPLTLRDWGMGLDNTMVNGGVVDMGEFLPKGCGPGMATVASHW